MNGKKVGGSHILDLTHPSRSDLPGKGKSGKKSETKKVQGSDAGDGATMLSVFPLLLQRPILNFAHSSNFDRRGEVVPQV
jgi:hypothetical protein